MVINLLLASNTRIIALFVSTQLCIYTFKNFILSNLYMCLKHNVGPSRSAHFIILTGVLSQFLWLLIITLNFFKSCGNGIYSGALSTYLNYLLSRLQEDFIFRAQEVNLILIEEFYENEVFFLHKCAESYLFCNDQLQKSIRSV